VLEEEPWEKILQNDPAPPEKFWRAGLRDNFSDLELVWLE
jgi:hypothetical protein